MAHHDNERRNAERAADAAGRRWQALVAIAHRDGIEALHDAVVALGVDEAHAALLAGAYIEAQRITLTQTAHHN